MPSVKRPQITVIESDRPRRPRPFRYAGWVWRSSGNGWHPTTRPSFATCASMALTFGSVDPENGLDQVLSAATARAKAHPAPYAHWYVDGGQPAEHDPLLTCVSYQSLEPVRAALLRSMQKQIARPGMGPEELRSYLARLAPADLGMDKTDLVLDRFQIKLLTEGSGTQIFSTTFAQWATREVLRRAQALTLVVRFAPRQRQKPMNEMLTGADRGAELDPVGSLIDADMGAYYHWINQQRLPGSEQSAFVVWFEGHGQAVVVAPSLPRGTESNTRMDLAKLLSLASS